jgi:energy-converting hydrogenase Eha subunit C
MDMLLVGSRVLLVAFVSWIFFQMSNAGDSSRRKVFGISLYVLGMIMIATASETLGPIGFSAVLAVVTVGLSLSMTYVMNFNYDRRSGQTVVVCLMSGMGVGYIGFLDNLLNRLS